MIQSILFIPARLSYLSLQIPQRVRTSRLRVCLWGSVYPRRAEKSRAVLAGGVQTPQVWGRLTEVSAVLPDTGYRIMTTVPIACGFA